MLSDMTTAQIVLISLAILILVGIKLIQDFSQELDTGKKHKKASS